MKPSHILDNLKNLIQIRQPVFVWGAPGVGKSRLITEFSSAMAENGILVWSGASSPQKSDHAFSLLYDFLARALKIRAMDTPEQIRTKVNQAMESWPRETKLVRPYLEILLGVRPSGLEAERLSSLEPEQLRQQVFVAIRRLIKILGTQRPLVLLLDDYIGSIQCQRNYSCFWSPWWSRFLFFLSVLNIGREQIIPTIVW